MDTPYHPEWQRQSGGDYTWEVPDGWGQGRAFFGGLVASSTLALSRYATARPLRTLQLNFLAPVRPGSLQAELAVLRDGRSTTVTEVRLRQREQLAATATLTFIQPRPESRAVKGEPAPDWGPPEDHVAMPYIEGLVPDFTRHLEYRITEGGFPYSGQETPLIGGYVRLREDEDTSPELQLALLDAWPCPTITLLDGFAPSSSVTWSAHLLEPLLPGWARFRYRSLHAKDGFSTSVGTMWRSDGRLAAYSEQSIAVFDGR